MWETGLRAEAGDLVFGLWTPAGFLVAVAEVQQHKANRRDKMGRAKREEPLHKFSLATAVAIASVLGGPALADPCTIDVLVASSSAKMLAGMALALSGLSVTASMFIVRKGL